MRPFVLSSSGLYLDQPRQADVPAIAEYCRDPVFEHFMTLPWPYTRGDAEYFVEEYVPRGWATGSELTWAIRLRPAEPLLGAIGLRLVNADLGFWLGAPHRGKGYMPEAVHLVTEWVFTSGFAGLSAVNWECVIGNTASLSVARKSGFTFTGGAPCLVTARDGSHPDAWHGVLRRGDDAAAKPGWPLVPPAAPVSPDPLPAESEGDAGR